MPRLLPTLLCGAALAVALASPAAADDAALLTLSDTKGRQYLVSTESISYVELGAEAGRKVGFVS